MDDKSREVFEELQKQDDLEKIKELIDDGFCDEEAVILNEEDLEEVQRAFRKKLDWRTACYQDEVFDWLSCQLDKALDADKTYVIPFADNILSKAIDNGYCEYVVTGVTSRRELGQKWLEYCNRLGIDPKVANGYFTR